jgi:uncharacterized protein YndB with AHSA1/START domain
VPRVTAELEVAAPAEEAFAVVADPDRRRRLLPDNFSGFRVLSETRAGPGTRTAFRITTPQGDHETLIEVTDWNPPHSLTEQAIGESPYSVRWTFTPAAGGARVTATMDYEVGGSPLHRLVERWFARRVLRQSLLVELLRLKELLAGGAGPTQSTP